MAIKTFGSNVTGIYCKGSEVSRVYHKGDLVWESGPPVIRLTGTNTSDTAFSHVFNSGDEAKSWIAANKATLKTLKYDDIYGLTTDANEMFRECSSLILLDLSNFNTSNVTNMVDMFLYCTALTTLDLSSFDTSNVTAMYGMFRYCTALTTLDLSSFDTSNITAISVMFFRCSALTSLDLSSWNVLNVDGELTAQAFYSCDALTEAWGRTQADCDILNSSVPKPANVNFIVKPQP